MNFIFICSSNIQNTNIPILFVIKYFKIFIVYNLSIYCDINTFITLSYDLSTSKGLIKQMETHGISVGVPHDLAQDIHLLGHSIDITSVVFCELLQHVSSRWVKRSPILRSRETVAVGSNHVVSSLLKNIQAYSECLHLIGVVVSTKRLVVGGQRYLEGTPHLAPPLEDVLDHVLASAPHLVTLLHEELAESKSVCSVRVERGRHQEEVHAINEVVYNDPMKSVGVSLEAPMD